ncbi:MAG: patatin-like phospholipase family protein [Prolixibacteraceae bacterium]|nr:patatin-like phospholipase family protein [Prolixibacteraceae bacterium]
MRNALLLTGAAARISQEVAIIDKLIEHKGLEITPENTMLAGFSSGALNIAALNACFRKENPLSWDDYYKNEILFNITNDDVFKKNSFIPLDTKPLRKTVDGFLEKANMNSLDDCAFQSYILAFWYRKLKTFWAYNENKNYKNLSLSDLMMATTAIPIIFPDQKILSVNNSKSKFKNDSFGDGGAGGTFKRFETHLKKNTRKNGGFDNIYIISPMREVTHDDYQDLYNMIPSFEILKLQIKQIKLLRIFLEMISQNGFDTFIKRFYKWTKKRAIANNIYVCIPKLPENFPILNFNLQKKQYQCVIKWFDENPDELAIPIEKYFNSL